jgi:hypothetical protein
VLANMLTTPLIGVAATQAPGSAHACHQRDLCPVEEDTAGQEGRRGRDRSEGQAGASQRRQGGRALGQRPIRIQSAPSPPRPFPLTHAADPDLYADSDDEADDDDWDLEAFRKRTEEDRDAAERARIIAMGGRVEDLSLEDAQPDANGVEGAEEPQEKPVDPGATGSDAAA